MSIESKNYVPENNEKQSSPFLSRVLILAVLAGVSIGTKDAEAASPFSVEDGFKDSITHYTADDEACPLGINAFLGVFKESNFLVEYFEKLRKTEFGKLRFKLKYMKTLECKILQIKEMLKITPKDTESYWAGMKMKNDLEYMMHVIEDLEGELPKLEGNPPELSEEDKKWLKEEGVELDTDTEE